MIHWPGADYKCFLCSRARANQAHLSSAQAKLRKNGFTRRRIPDMEQPPLERDECSEARDEDDEAAEYDEEDEEDLGHLIEIHIILKKRTGRNGGEEYFVRYKGGKKDQWLAENHLGRQGKALIRSFNRTHTTANAPNPVLQADASIEPILLHSIRLLELSSGGDQAQEFQLIGARINSTNHATYLCGMCKKPLLGPRKMAEVVTFISRTSRALLCFAKGGSAAHLFHDWCASEWLEQSGEMPVCPLPYCDVRPLPVSPTMPPSSVRLGFDLGGVLIDRFANDISGFNFLSDNESKYLEAAAVLGGFEGVKRFIIALGAESVFIISGRTMMEKKLKWHDTHCHWTGFWQPNAFFVDRWPEKARICRDVGITHFVDDKLELMLTLRGIVTNLFFFQTPDKAASMASKGHRVEEYKGEFIHCTSWDKIFDLTVAPTP